jgi:hypothetical protein
MTHYCVTYLSCSHYPICNWVRKKDIHEFIELIGAIWRTDTANQRRGSVWEPIRILLEGDGGSNKMKTTSNTRLQPTTKVGQAHAATGVLLDLGTNSQPHRPENAAEHKTRASLTYTGQAGENHRSDRSLQVKPGDFHITDLHRSGR